MPFLDISDGARKFLMDLDAKQYKQVAKRLIDLITNTLPADSSLLKGYSYRRLDMGEYRVIYEIRQDCVYIHIIGKRNDDEVYKELKRKR